MRRLPRIAVSFVLVLAAFGTYAVTAVPLMDPPARVEKNFLPPPPGVEPSESTPLDEGMLAWFGPDRNAWELDKPKMLRNDQGILLFDRYESLEGGKVRLNKVSMVFLSDDQTLDPKVRQRQAVVMRAPAGAVLEFDRNFNIRRGKVGQLKGGTLIGEIEITSDGKSPGREDDLRVVTHDVELSQSRISTKHWVKFVYGLNAGQGEGLEIKLAQEDEDRGASRLGQIKSLTLQKHVVLNLVVKDGGRATAGFGPMPLAAQPPALREFSPDQPIVVQQGAPVTVKCQGPFHFDGQENLATFEQHVEVVRQHPTGEPDKLTCQHLLLYLDNPSDSPPEAAKAETENARSEMGKGLGGKARLNVRRVVAKGNPVVLNVPGSAAYARGQRMEYDLQTRRVSLIDEREVIFRHENNEIHARELHYQPGLEGRLGQFRAVGAGRLDWAVRDPRSAAEPRSFSAGPAASPSETRRFQASWSRQLNSKPHEGRQIISLEGEASSQVTSMGRIDADEIHAWLFEVPQPLVAGQQPPEKTKYTFLADRMQAKVNVVVDSPQLTGRTQKLDIFVRHPQSQAAVPGAVPQAGAGVAGGGASAGMPVVSPQPAPNGQQDLAGRLAGGKSSQRFDVTGQHVQVQLVQVGREAQLSQLDILGNARLLETKTAKPGERPFQVMGDYVHATQPQPNQALFNVNGKPAHVEGRGLSLTGGAVNVNQRTNKLWIDGAGVMTLMLDRDLQGKPTGGAPQPLEINWQGRMEFDGQTAEFHQAVVARRQQESVQTQILKVSFNRAVDFAQPKQDAGERPDVEKIVCEGGVHMERRTSDERGALSHEKMQALDLTIVNSSGAILGNGPGWITRWYKSTGNHEVSLPGLGPIGPGAKPKAGDARPKPGNAGAPADTLNYLRVDFQRALRGNFKQQVMIFSDQVQAVHVPVQNWGETINADRLEQLGERGVALKCDELNLRQMSQGERKWFEAMASGNTLVEGQTFTAKALRMSYSQDKELLTLEGTDRTPADLWRQESVGAPQSNLQARKIEYWRQTNHIKIDKAQFGQVSDIPPSKQPGRPKAPPGAKPR